MTIRPCYTYFFYFVGHYLLYTQGAVADLTGLWQYISLFLEKIEHKSVTDSFEAEFPKSKT